MTAPELRQQAYALLAEADDLDRQHGETPVSDIQTEAQLRAEIRDLGDKLDRCIGAPQGTELAKIRRQIGWLHELDARQLRTVLSDMRFRVGLPA